MVTLQVLYDDVLALRVGKLTRRVVAGLDRAADPLLFGDINGRPLQLPTLVYPYRRALSWVAQCAYKIALSSPKPHCCATASCPTEDAWNRTFEELRTASEGFGDSVFAK